MLRAITSLEAWHRDYAEASLQAMQSLYEMRTHDERDNWDMWSNDRNREVWGVNEQTLKYPWQGATEK
jgi:hypothetical protein